MLKTPRSAPVQEYLEVTVVRRQCSVRVANPWIHHLQLTHVVVPSPPRFHLVFDEAHNSIPNVGRTEAALRQHMAQFEGEVVRQLAIALGDTDNGGTEGTNQEAEARDNKVADDA